MPRTKKRDPRDAPVPRNRPYGERQKNMEAAAATRASGSSGPGELPAAPGGGVSADAPPPGADPLAVAQGASLPMGMLAGPSRRPDVPVTDGMAMGPGRGPSALAPQQTGPTETELATYAKFLPALETLASRPDSTPGTRQYVRRLRAMLPPQYLQRMVAQGQPTPQTNPGG